MKTQTIPFIQAFSVMILLRLPPGGAELPDDQPTGR